MLSLFKSLFGKGFMFKWSDGKPFDPVDQERTDALEDIAKAKENKNGKAKGCTK
jgi:hypothetical protein